MKKLLAIIVLGLVWSNLSSAKLGDSYYNEINDNCLEQNKGDLGKKFCKCYMSELDNRFSDETLMDQSTTKKEKKILKGFKDARNLCQKQISGKKSMKKSLKQSTEFDVKKNTRKVTVESILNKYKNTLPDCENGEVVNFSDTKRWMAWKNCFGTVLIKFPDSEQEYITMGSPYTDSGTGGILIITHGPENEINPGTKFFQILTKKGCKKKGHGISPDGDVYNILWNQRCDEVKKMTLLSNKN